jgi:thiol-disulfide isomerase/thioredoxin
LTKLNFFLKYLSVKTFGLVISLFLIVAADGAVSPQRLIGELGFKPLASTPADFTLPVIGKSGGQESLSSHKGKWIWLTFWATWCGPCRMEMPSLEYLHGALQGENIAFLGVAIDQGSPATVARFLKQYEITFDNFHDQNGRAASLYRASAVPTIYLISPDWKLVGIFRGGRSWQSPKVVETVKELINHQTMPDLGPDSGQTGAVELPNNLAPPQMSITLPEGEILVGSDKMMRVEVIWPGQSSDYLIKAPKITLPDSVERGVLSSSSESDDGSTHLYYSLPIKFLAEGTFRMGPIELTFQDRMQGGRELTTKVEGGELVVIKSYLYYYLAGSGLLFLLVSGAVGWIFQRNRSGQADGGARSGDRERELQQQLKEFQRLKVDGKTKEYSVKLLQLVSQLPRLDQKEQQRLASMEEQVKYAGKSLSSDQLIYYEKIIAKSVQEEE